MKRFASDVVCLVGIILGGEPTGVHSFSAQLSRPWEGPRSASTTLARLRRRRKWWEEDVALYTTSPTSSTQEQDASDDASTTDEPASPLNEQDDEPMSLLQGRDTSHIVMAQPNAVLRHETPSSNLTPATNPLRQEQSKNDTLRSHWRLLWSMTRPSNFLGVVLFHIMGVYLALSSSPNIKADAQLLLSTLLHPSMLVVLLSLLLTSSTSMVVNDYFDHKMGVDSLKTSKPLEQGTVSMQMTKRFLYYLYGALLLCLTAIPGIPARLMVVFGIMLTYIYTQHLKPITWLKNIVCAALISLSPSTSGAAAFCLNSSQSLQVLAIPSLWRFIGMLFAGFLGREILMDINDVDEDESHQVRTIPVKYGRKFAAKTSLVCTLFMATGSWVGPLLQIGRAANWSWTALSSTLQTSSGGAARKLILATVGNVAMIGRAWEVYKTDGEDRKVVDRAIEEGKLTIMFLLASYV